MYALRTCQSNDRCEQPRCSVPNPAATPAVVYIERGQLKMSVVLCTSHMAEGAENHLAQTKLLLNPSETGQDAHPVQRQPLLDTLSRAGVLSDSCLQRSDVQLPQGLPSHPLCEVGPGIQGGPQQVFERYLLCAVLQFAKVGFRDPAGTKEQLGS